MAHNESHLQFTDEELLDLLRDETVSPQSIASEMEDAGAEKTPAEVLETARRVLKSLAAEDVAVLDGLPDRLRGLLVGEAIRTKAVPFLTALSQSPNKAFVKDAKRAIHLLKTRGVAIEAPRAAAPATPPSAAPAQEELPTFMSSVNGVGERVLFVSSTARGGYDVAQLVISDEVGICSATIAALGRKEYKRLIQGLSSTKTGMVGEVPRTYARHLIAAALDLNARARRPVPPGFNDVSFILGAAGAPQRSPGRALSAEPGALDALHRGAELLDIDVLRGWIPSEDVLRPLELKLLEVQASTLYIDEAQREHQRNVVIHDAVRTYWTGDRRRLWAERLFDTAHLLQGAGRTEPSQWARAAAEALESDAPAESISFCVAYLSPSRTAASLAGSANGTRYADRRLDSPLILPGS